MLHTVILAGSDVSVDQTRAELPMFLEQSTGTTSRFRSVVQAVTGDVFSPPTVVTTLSTADAVSSQLKQDGSRGSLLLEPDAHKPAAAMLAALMHMRQSPESLVLFLPASMDFKSPEELDIALCHAIPAAQRGEVVVLSARTPAAGRATPSFEVSQAPRLNKPVEVDRVASAGQSFLDGLFRRGHIVWSTGVVLARVDVLLAAYKRNASRMFLTVKEAVRTACNVREGVLLAEAAYNQLKPVVFEAVVSAKTSHLVTIPTGAALSEFNLWDEDLSDERKGRFELSQTPEPQPWRAAQVLSVFDGSEGVAASKQLVFTPGETNSQEWGARELLAQNGPLTLQRLSIAPGARLELNPHRYEAEQWIVLQGSALIGVGGQMKLLMENQSMRVPAGCLRSVENPGQSVLQLVQLRFDPTPATPSPETIGAA